MNVFIKSESFQQTKLYELQLTKKQCFEIMKYKRLNLQCSKMLTNVTETLSVM